MNDITLLSLIDALIDVMLVLLIVLPVLLHEAVKLEMPSASPSPHGGPIAVAIDSAGAVWWNNVPVDAEGLTAHLTQTAALTDPPVLQLHADRRTPYWQVARVLSSAQRSGLHRIHFMTEE